MHQECRGFIPFLAVCSVLAPETLSILDAEQPNSVRIKASDPDPFDTFGRAVSISGAVAVVGAIWVDDNGLDSGAAYVFEFAEGKWSETQKLLSSDGGANDWFGRAAAIDAETIFVSANGGRVYVYESNGSVWTETQVLTPSDGDADGGGFGHSLALRGSTVIIGTPSADADDGFISGAAYVFRFDSGSRKWIEEAKILPPELPPVPGLGFGFGFDVAFDRDVVFIAAAGDNSACPDNLICGSGTVYVFRFNEESRTWSEEQKLLASDAACGDNFGLPVAVQGDVALIGAPFKANDNGLDAGSVYVFRFDAETSQWVEEQKLLASDGLPGDQFGRALAMDGDLAVIGAWLADPVGNSSGAAYVFRRGPDGVWTEECKLLPEPNGTTQIFGKAIALDCGRVIIGAKGEDTQSGAAYIFELSTNPADLNGDCDVGAFDLALLLASWGPCPKPCEPGEPAQACPADLDGDCTVGPTDLAMLLGSWG